MTKTRAHHNNKGYVQIKHGRPAKDMQKLAQSMGVPYGAKMTKQLPIPCPVCMGETNYTRPARAIEITCQHCKTILIIKPIGKLGWDIRVKSEIAK